MQFRVARCDVVRHGRATAEVLRKALSSLPDGYFKFLGKSIDDGRTDTVQSSSRFIDALGKFSTGMRHGENDGGGRQVIPLVEHRIKGHAARFVTDSDPAIAINTDPDMFTEARYRFVDGI